LAAIYFSIPQNEFERSSTNKKSTPNDEGKKELNDILNNTPEAKDLRDSEYEVLIRKGDG
jgi:hypothetical protein